MDAAGECLLYYEPMTRVYLADALTENVRPFVYYCLIFDLIMEVVGEVK